MKRATTRKEGPCCMCPDQSLYPCSLSAVSIFVKKNTLFGGYHT